MNARASGGLSGAAVRVKTNKEAGAAAHMEGRPPLTTNRRRF